VYFSERMRMLSDPNFASVALMYCSFCSVSLCGRTSQMRKLQLWNPFASSPSNKLFHNLVAHFVGLEGKSRAELEKKVV
jgi:hypothetical protein